MKAIYKFASAAVLLIAAPACKPDLTVQDLSDPDIAHVFATGAFCAARGRMPGARCARLSHKGSVP